MKGGARASPSVTFHVVTFPSITCRSLIVSWLERSSSPRSRWSPPPPERHRATAHPAPSPTTAVARAVPFHLHLEKSEPAKDQVLDQAPSVIRLWYSMPPELAVTMVKLTRADGAVVTTAAPRRGRMAPPRLKWRSSSRSPPVATSSAGRRRPRTGIRSRATSPSASSPEPDPKCSRPSSPTGRWRSRGRSHSAGSWPWWGRRSSSSASRRDLPVGSTEAQQEGARTRRLLWVTCAVLAIAAAWRLAQQGAAFADTPSAWPSMVPVVLLQMSWGTGWWVQVAGVLLAALATGRASRSRTARTALGAGALLLAVSPALMGHAIGAPRLATQAMVADTMHVLAAGAWLGTLLAIAVAVLPSQYRSARLGHDRPRAILPHRARQRSRGRRHRNVCLVAPPRDARRPLDARPTGARSS